MLQWMKAGMLVVGSLAFTAGVPTESSAFFPWLYDSMYAPPGYGYGYAPYGYGYYAPGYQSAFYAPGYNPGCGCMPACNPCDPCVRCSPCGTNCPGGNCGVNPAPANPPVPEPDSATDPTAPPSRPPRRTYETDPADATEFEPPMSPARGSSGPRSRTLPEDDFSAPRGNSERGPRGNEPAGASGASASDGFDASSDPDAIPMPGDTRKPPLSKQGETVIPQKKPAEVAPVDESTKDGGLKLDNTTTSRPVIQKQRLALRARPEASAIARHNPNLGVKWSGLDTHVVRH
jgi:hypothetical protein